MIASTSGVTVRVVEASPAGIVTLEPRLTKSDPDVALPKTVKFTSRAALMSPVPPLLVNVNVPGSGPTSDAAASVAVTVTVGRTNAATTMVCSVAMLSAGVSSTPLDVTAAVLVMSPATAAVAGTVIVTDCNGASVPMAQTAWPATIEHVPWDAVGVVIASPAGIGSTTTTSVAVVVPVFVTVSVYVNGVVTTTGSAESTFVSDSLTPWPAGTSVAAMVCVLFATTRSGWSALTDAVLRTVPVPATAYAAVTTTVPPGAMSPSSHVICPDVFVQLPWVAVVVTPVVPNGTPGFSVTPVAVAGPPLVTRMV